MKEEDKQYLSQVGMYLADLFYNQNKMKQTAVEWLIEQMKKCNITVSVHNTSHQNVMDFYKAIDQAKEMEKAEKDKQYQRGFKDGSKHIKIIYNL